MEALGLFLDGFEIGSPVAVAAGPAVRVAKLATTAAFPSGDQLAGFLLERLASRA